MSTILPHMAWPYCKFRMLNVARWKCRTQKIAKNVPSVHHLTTCRAVSSQLRHVSTIGKKLVKQQYLFHMSSQYGERWPTNHWDQFTSLGHPSTFQRVLRLGSVTARHSSNGRQPNFVVLNRECHVYSAGRPSCWALAHVLVINYFTNQLVVSCTIKLNGQDQDKPNIYLICSRVWK